MFRTRHSRLLMLGGIILAVLLWLLDSVVDYAIAATDLTFVEMVFSPPLHAAFSRSLLASAALAVAWAGSRVIELLDLRRRRIEHLNTVLRSLHDVNHLIVEADDVLSLLRDATELLVLGRGYRSAWVVRVGDEGEISDVLSHGLGDLRQTFEAALCEGELASCFERVGGEEIALLVRPDRDGRDCCVIESVYPDDSGIIAPMRYAGRLEGYLGVSLPGSLTPDKEELELVHQIAGDLAMGIHGIETERELELHTALLSEAERLASLGAWHWDVAEGKFHLSEELRRIFGVEERIVGPAELLSIAHPDDRASIEQEFEEVLAGSGEYAVEHRIIRQTDREERWIDGQGEALRADDGSVIAVYGAAQDITGRKRAEERLRESREELAAIYANAPVTMLLVDRDRGVRKINGYAAQIIGKPEEELVGLRGGEALRCLDHLDDPRGCGFGEACEYCIVRDAVVSTFETGESRRQVEATIPLVLDGEQQCFTFLVSTVLLEHHAEPLVLLTMENITERKRAEQELRTLSRFREAIIDQANTAVVVFNPEGRVVIWNRAVEEMTGYAPEDVMGQNAWDRLLGDEEAGAATVEMVRAVIEEDSEFADVETLIHAADGSERLLSWHARGLADEDGRPLGAVAMGRDITEQRELERRLERSQRMEAIGRLAGGVAHDFNNMLTAIMGNAKLLEMELEDEQARTRLREIQHAGQRSAALTGQLLTFSRQVTTEPTVFDLNLVVRQMRSMLDRMTREDTAVELGLASQPMCVTADRAQMEQVLMNLVVNARDAMPGGGTIRIETAREEISRADAEAATGLSPGPHVRLRVIDTGCGMDEHTLARAFEPFFTTREEGTGLGLATVYGIVQRSSGEIEIDSAPGEGTTVTVRLPLAAEAADGAHPGADAARSRSEQGSRARVLLVEDEEHVRRLIETVLTRSGYEVVPADSAEAALESFGAADGSVDILLTDVVMSGIGGVELAERLRKIEPELPVLFISGYTELELPRWARLLQKPFVPGELLDAMREVLEDAGG
ncbi:MAG: PAS domain S-box protein [Armatimonadota bacterium]|jgi:two-component system cell cycle sensor histidine kinase/response regulator CckA